MVPMTRLANVGTGSDAFNTVVVAVPGNPPDGSYESAVLLTGDKG